VLEIVEGEAIGSCVCTQAYASLTSGCMRWVLVSMGWLGRINAGVVTSSMLPGRPRREGRSCPSGSAASRCWRKAFNRPVLKHGPRSLTCMRAGGWQTHEAQVT
jgi:hypothetical protein